MERKRGRWKVVFVLDIILVGGITVDVECSIIAGYLEDEVWRAERRSSPVTGHVALSRGKNDGTAAVCLNRLLRRHHRGGGHGISLEVLCVAQHVICPVTFQGFYLHRHQARH